MLGDTQNERAAVKRLLVFALVVTMTGFSAAQTPEVKVKRGGTLRAVFGSDPPTLDPAHATDLTSSAVIRQVFDALLELDETLRVVPALARRWTTSADARVYTFLLRDGVRFHNGRALTAADVKYSLERAAKGKRPWVVEKITGARAFISGNAGDIAGIRVVDDLTVELHLDQPFAPFLSLIAYDAASIVPREEVDRRGSGFASHPVGTGAFRFVSWRRDDQVILERFPEHFRGPALLDRVVFRIIPAEITRYNEYMAGQLDMSDIPTGRCRAAQADPRLKGEAAVWPTLGIPLALRRLDWAAHIKLVDEGRAGFFRQGWIADYPDPENFLTVLFHSKNAGAAGNTSRYRNPKLDRLFDEADAMSSGPARYKRYAEAEQIVLDDAVWISLYHYTSRALIKPYVKGLERSAQSSAPEFLAPLRKVWLDH